jgi:dihydroorotate dehydrogenase (fumarate)
VIDLTTRYLGLDLPSPLVMSSSPLCEDLDAIRRAEDAGAGAVVLHSLFEEQIEIERHDLDRHLTHGTHSVAEALTYFPAMTGDERGPERYLEHLRRAKAAVDIPVIASLNGVSAGGWIEYARRMEQAGADGIELNVYFVPTDPLMTGAEVETMYTDLARAVRLEVAIPVAVKLPHFLSAIPIAI